MPLALEQCSSAFDPRPAVHLLAGGAVHQPRRGAEIRRVLRHEPKLCRVGTGAAVLRQPRVHGKQLPKDLRVLHRRRAGIRPGANLLRSGRHMDIAAHHRQPLPPAAKQSTPRRRHCQRLALWREHMDEPVLNRDGQHPRNIAPRCARSLPRHQCDWRRAAGRVHVARKPSSAFMMVGATALSCTRHPGCASPSQVLRLRPRPRRDPGRRTRRTLLIHRSPLLDRRERHHTAIVRATSTRRQGPPCVAAHSMVRALYAKFVAPLYLLQRKSDWGLREIGSLTAGGYANAVEQDTFCAGTDDDAR